MGGEFLLIAGGLLLAGILLGGFRRGVYRRSVPGAVCVMVLVRDQERVVEGFLRELLQMISAVPAVELVAVDEGSSDLTPEIVERMGRRFPLRVLERGCRDPLGDHAATLVLRLTDEADAGRLLALAKAALGGARAAEGREAVARFAEGRDL